MSEQYRLMIYFAVATFHFYRNDIIPLEVGERYGVFAEKNKAVIKRVCDEALTLFQYELSDEQIGRAVKAYTAEPRPLATTEPADLASINS